MEDSKLSSEVPEEKSATEDVPVKAMNEETSKEEEKEEEDTTSDGGYVKVEKEGIDTKDDDEKTEFENSRKMIKEKESVYALLKNQEENIRTANEKLTKVLKENELLEAEITCNDAKMKEICNELEEKLKCSDEKISKTDALLSQAWSNNSELKHKLKSLEQIYKDFGSAVTENGTQKSLSLEDIVRSSLQEAEEAKSQLKDLKTEFIATGNVNVELEKRLKLLQLKNSDADVELKRLSEKISELKSALEVAKNEEKQSLNQKQEYQKKVTKLESSLSKYEQTEADSKRYLGQVANLKSTLEDFQVKTSKRYLGQEHHHTGFARDSCCQMG